MRLLLINPNTSSHITGWLAESARSAMQAGDLLTSVTARSGPAVVRCAEGLLEAEANALSLADKHAAGHDAIVLGISLDGVASRLRARHMGQPVIGMTEAALMSACLRADRIGLLTIGPALLPLYLERVRQIGVASRVVGYEAPDLPEAFSDNAAQEPLALMPALVAAGHRLRRSNAQVIVLAGAVLGRHARSLADRLAMPVFDGVSCAVSLARVLTAQGCWPSGQPQSRFS